MYEFVFVVFIFFNSQLVGQQNTYAISREVCEVFQHALVEDSLRIPKTSPLKTTVSECRKVQDT